jgi:hypothetical protein
MLARTGSSPRTRTISPTKKRSSWPSKRFGPLGLSAGVASEPTAPRRPRHQRPYCRRDQADRPVQRAARGRDWSRVAAGRLTASVERTGGDAAATQIQHENQRRNILQVFPMRPRGLEPPRAKRSQGPQPGSRVVRLLRGRKMRPTRPGASTDRTHRPWRLFSKCSHDLGGECVRAVTRRGRMRERKFGKAVGSAARRMLQVWLTRASTGRGSSSSRTSR